MLTIIGGDLRGSKLDTPKGREFRPTLAKTREALFSVLSSRFTLSSFICVDLFAGSGALGFEAISRGLKHCFFIDINKSNIILLKKNVKRLHLESKCSVNAGDAIKWIKSNLLTTNPYLFFIDPPYESELAQQALDALNELNDKLGNSLIVLETGKNIQINIPESMEHFQQKKYGGTKLDFLKIIQRS